MRQSTRDNCFDVLRLLAAALVLVSHSFALTGRGEPTLGDTSLGVAGVEIFFVISGFLVTGSWLANPRWRAFLLKRGLRILPAFVVTIAVTAFLLGPLVSTLSTGTYLRSGAPAHYVGDNVVAVVSAGAVDHLRYRLPGVFTDNRTAVVNGSLWTLPVEIRAYLLVLLLGAFGLVLRWSWLAVAAGLVLLAGPESSSLYLLLVTIFGVAALLQVYRERVPLKPWLAAAALAVWALSAWLPLSSVLAAISVPYLVVFLAYRAPKGVRALARPGDVSYGVYLLAFPVQQTIVLLFGDIGPLALIAIALPVTYLLALASWRVVERPALGLKRLADRDDLEPALPARRGHDGDVAAALPVERTGHR